MPVEQSFGDGPLAGKRVVVCEDEGITVLQLARVLTHAGMVVVGCAVDGEEAVEFVLRQRPDVVIMDINMPRMNGIEAMRRIMAVHRPAVIMLTAFADELHLEEALKAGAVGYIVKPVMGDELIGLIEEALTT